jgi:hypothetical protein
MRMETEPNRTRTWNSQRVRVHPSMEGKTPTPALHVHDELRRPQSHLAMQLYDSTVKGTRVHALDSHRRQRHSRRW